MDALCSTGQLYAVGRLLLTTEAPSWLYPVTVGATTIWELWDALQPDGSLHQGDMVSFNPDRRRRPDVRAQRAAHSVRARRRRLAVDDGRLTVTAVVPPAITAEVELPDGPRPGVAAGEHTWTLDWAPAEPPARHHDLDSDIAELVDDPEALGLVRAVLGEHDPGRAKGFEGGIRYVSGIPLRSAPMFAAPSTFAAVEDALRDLDARR